MKNENNINRLSEILRNDNLRYITIGVLLVLGVVFLFISDFFSAAASNFLIGMAISILVGTLIGFSTGHYLGWPMGLWMGLLGGLFISPWLSFSFKNVVAAYYSSFIGPVVGALIGRWSELKNRDKMYKRAEEMKSELEEHQKKEAGRDQKSELKKKDDSEEELNYDQTGK